MALEQYKYCVDELWEQYGEKAWILPWKEIHSRPPATKANIVAELRAITDLYATLSVPMILDNIEGAQEACTALSAAYDAPAVTELRVFNLGDSAAMVGILIAGRCITGEAIFLVFLVD